ncbi:MAG: hypothetical protein U1E61_06195 [Bradyrhizobium sp.]
MAHQQADRAAVDGKRPVAKFFRNLARSRRLAFVAAAFFVTWGAAAYAQSGPFAGMAGNWSGGGTVTLDDGSKERLRCRATYNVPGSSMLMVLTCASDAYKFDLRADVAAAGNNISGTWSETSRNVGGSVSGHGSGGNFQVVAITAGVNANINLRTTGNKQSITIRSEGFFRGADISLSK